LSEKEGVTLLVTMAIRNGHSGIARLLIVRGAEVNAVDGDGKSPMMAACEKGDLRTVKALLTKGAAVEPVVNGGETALTIAIHGGGCDLHPETRLDAGYYHDVAPYGWREESGPR
jgi:ankyrin repeat protein